MSSSIYSPTLTDIPGESSPPLSESTTAGNDVAAANALVLLKPV